MNWEHFMNFANNSGAEIQWPIYTVVGWTVSIPIRVLNKFLELLPEWVLPAMQTRIVLGGFVVLATWVVGNLVQDIDRALLLSCVGAGGLSGRPTGDKVITPAAERLVDAHGKLKVKLEESGIRLPGAK